jgi:hypothetical protein
LLLPRLVSLRGLVVVAVGFFPAAVLIFVIPPPSPLIALLLAAAMILTRLVMSVPPRIAVLAPRLIFDDDRPDLRDIAESRFAHLGRCDRDRAIRVPLPVRLVFHGRLD